MSKHEMSMKHMVTPPDARSTEATQTSMSDRGPVGSIILLGQYAALPWC